VRLSLARFPNGKSDSLRALDSKELMITRNEVKMVISGVVGVLFISASMFFKTINAEGGKPYPLKWYHRLIGIFIGIVSIITAIQLYGAH